MITRKKGTQNIFIKDKKRKNKAIMMVHRKSQPSEHDIETIKSYHFCKEDLGRTCFVKT